MKKSHLFTIKYASRRSGLPAHLIRTWENRYEAVKPQRSANNRRLYSESDVMRLQLLSKAVGSGHSISQVARLASEELMRVINLNAPKADEIQATVDRKHNVARYYSEALVQIINLDAAGLEHTFDQASIHLTKPELILKLIVPLSNQVQKMQSGGKMSEINGIMATTVIHSCMWSMLRSLEFPETAPKIVIATAIGHHDELDALVLALTASESGWKSIYFGPNLPAEEIAAATEKTKSRAVVLTSNCYTKNRYFKAEVTKLRRLSPNDVEIFIFSRDFKDEFLPIDNIVNVRSYDDFRTALEAPKFEKVEKRR
jgi:methanogenic corrinoid protein MtbC1